VLKQANFDERGNFNYYLDIPRRGTDSNWGRGILFFGVQITTKLSASVTTSVAIKMITRRAGAGGEATPPVPSESAFSRLIVAPVLFVSFLLSLFIIDRETVGGVFGRSAGKNTYYHSHQRKLAKYDVDEAFRRKNRVIAAMIVSGAVGLALTGWAVQKVYWSLMKP
jgi:hypothetical protein